MSRNYWEQNCKFQWDSSNRDAMCEFQLVLVKLHWEPSLERGSDPRYPSWLDLGWASWSDHPWAGP